MKRTSPDPPPMEPDDEERLIEVDIENRTFPTFATHGKPIDLVIYHQKCPDGLTSAAIAWRKLGQKANFLGCAYSNAMPEVAGKHVLVVDFSFSKEVTGKLQEKAASFLVLDHHKTAMEELSDNPMCHFDMKRSGATMTWDFFFPNEPRPTMVEYVQDRDLWTWALPNSEAFSLALELIPTWPDAYGRFLEETIVNPKVLEAHFDKGSLLVAYRDMLVNNIAYKAIEKEWLSYKVCIVNSPTLQSEIGNVLSKREGCDIGMVWCYEAKESRFHISLRTHHPNAPDVSVIAKKFGGGGHPRAAGFKMLLSHPDIKLLIGEVV